MNNRQIALWRAIESFDIDGGPSALTFARRLARENGWSLGFAERVIHEYKRFIFLAMEAGHPVSPSDEVDQAWHLHLTYCDSYWDRLNGEVLPRPLRHNPTRGGKSEGAKFNDWYQRTLDSYLRLFGEEPPADVWPAPAARFASFRFQRVNLDDYWLVPKVRPRARVFQIAGMCLVAAALAGCSAMYAQSGSGINSILPLVLVIAAFTGILVGFLALSRSGWIGGGDQKRRDGGATGGCGTGGCGSGGRGDKVDDGGSGCGSACGSGCGGGCGGCGG
jgi:hypothetical protein